MFNKKTGHRLNNAGSGWPNDDGSISLSLHPGVVLAYNPDFMYRLWPAEIAPADVIAPRPPGGCEDLPAPAPGPAAPPARGERPVGYDPARDDRPAGDPSTPDDPGGEQPF